MPSNIPVGTADLRRVWQCAPGFAEVPLQPADLADPQTERGVRFRAILRRQLEDAMAMVEAAAPDFIVTTGGDCGASFVPIAYMNKRHAGKIGVVWVDAHGDIHAPATSPSGHYHGMVLRHLMGDLDFDIQPPRPLRAGQIAYLGLRDTESAEDSFIAQQGIPRFHAQDVMESDAPLGAVLDHFTRHGVTHLHLHVDCDVMDQSAFPHVHVPEPDGLTLERLIDILQKLRARLPMSSCCLTEYAPATPGAGLDMVRRVYAEGLGLDIPAAS